MGTRGDSGTCAAVTKSGTWDSETWDSETWDSEMWDSEMWDSEMRDSGTWERVGTRERVKQTIPDICAEFVENNFRWSRESYYMLESSLVVADAFQRPWFGQTCLLAYFSVRTLGKE